MVLRFDYSVLLQADVHALIFLIAVAAQLTALLHLN